MAAEGIDVIQAFEHQPYDLVFMDVRMPEMDGLLVAQRYAGSGSNGPKIIAITALCPLGDRERCLEAGMDNYIASQYRRESCHRS